MFYPERVEARLAREAAAREQARRQRIASVTSPMVEGRAFGLVGRMEKPDGPDAELEPGPPNLDLFEARQ